MEEDRNIEPNHTTAGILITGNEVLNSVIRDENGPWLSASLAHRGVLVDRIVTVPDGDAEILAGLEHLADRGVDLIVTSGGLGPTADDRTAAVVGSFCGREMVLDPELEREIGEILARYARARGNHLPRDGLDEANRKQAMIPDGSVPLDPIGTAPGLVVERRDGPVVVVLPGPPRELHPMWAQACEVPAVRKLLDGAGEIRNLRIRMFGTPESQVALALREIEPRIPGFGQLEVTTCLRRGEMEIDIRHRPDQVQDALALRDGLVDRFPDTTFSIDGRTIDEIVAGLLRGRSVAVAESCSAGLLAARLTEVPGASSYFTGGIVAYSNQAKRDLLGVPTELIEEFGAVSPEVAAAMAEGALERFDADVSAGITGIAGPSGGSEEKPVGFVCFNVRTRGGGEVALSPTIPGDRSDVRERSALVAMHLFRRLLS